MCCAVSAALERPVTQATRAESHTSPITRAMATSSSVTWSVRSGSMAWVTIEVISMPTGWISAATDASANMKARVSASVRWGRPAGRGWPA